LLILSPPSIFFFLIMIKRLLLFPLSSIFKLANSLCSVNFLLSKQDQKIEGYTFCICFSIICLDLFNGYGLLEIADPNEGGSRWIVAYEILVDLFIVADSKFQIWNFGDFCCLWCCCWIFRFFYGFLMKLDDFLVFFSSELFMLCSSNFLWTLTFCSSYFPERRWRIVWRRWRK